jgi:GTP cyclohydrolase II
MTIDAIPSYEIRQIASAEFPTRWGQFRIFGFERDLDEGGWKRRESAVALLMGDLKARPPLLRIHSQCLTGDTLGSLRCDCGDQLHMAMQMIADEGAGILIYEAKEGRGIGLMAKLLAYELQDQGADTVEANDQLGLKQDYREFILPVEILRHFGVSQVRLLSNNPQKAAALNEAGITVVERVPCEPVPSEHAREYLRTKKEKMGQMLSAV